jgi:LemA protein
VSIWQWALLALATVLLFWGVGAYNRLVALRNVVGAAWLQLDEALQQRAAVVAPLVAALREGLVGEGAALDALLTAQAQVSAAADALRLQTVQAPASAVLVRAESLMVAATARVLALLELHPELRDDPAVAPQVARLRQVDGRLAFGRQRFNAEVQAYNDAVRQWPTRLLARVYGFGTAGRL